MTDQACPYETVPFTTETEQRAAADPVCAHLAAGGLIVYPTETVYGFGCMLETVALERLAAAKGRAPGKAFLLLVADAGSIEGVYWTDSARKLADAFWPGALTLALRARVDAFPPAVVGTEGTVAVRATSHPGVRILLEALGAPLTSTSANLPGSPPALSAKDAARALIETGAGRRFLVLDGGTLPASPPSTIVDCSTEPLRVVRAGAISAQRIAEYINGIDATQS